MHYLSLYNIIYYIIICYGLWVIRPWTPLGLVLVDCSGCGLIMKSDMQVAMMSTVDAFTDFCAVLNALLETETMGQRLLYNVYGCLWDLCLWADGSVPHKGKLKARLLNWLRKMNVQPPDFVLSYHQKPHALVVSSRTTVWQPSQNMAHEQLKHTPTTLLVNHWVELWSPSVPIWFGINQSTFYS